MKGKNIYEHFSLNNLNMDIDEFWNTAKTLPVIWIRERKFDRALFLSSRFNTDGSVRKTYIQIAKELDLTLSQVTYHCERALLMMKHPKRAKRFLKL
jgi:hypothetical protein